jgi:ribosomal protein S18 acetylase RimI-like enzyme
MRAAQAAEVAELHRLAFPGFFLTSLGDAFLRLYYQELIAQGQIAFVAEEGDRCVGVVVGSASPGAFYRNLLRRRLASFALASAPAAVRRPSSVGRILRALKKPGEAARPAGMATLMCVAVHPSHQGFGAGRRLVAQFLDEAASRGAIRADLTTDKHANEPANAFYRGLGFRLARELVTPEGRVLNEYEIDLRRGGDSRASSSRSSYVP